MLDTEVRHGSSIQNYNAISLRLYTPQCALCFHLPSDLFICIFISLWLSILIFGLLMFVLPSYTLMKEAFGRREAFIVVLMKLEVFW
jgi:hypothetical protein